MARLCERPGCSAPAACVYAIDTKRLRVRIDALSGETTDRVGLGHRAGVLCRRHADSMVVPLGWTLDDRRPTERRAAPSVAVQAPPSAPRRSSARRERHAPVPDGVEQLALLSLPEDPPDRRPAAAPVDTVPSPSGRAASVDEVRRVDAHEPGAPATDVGVLDGLSTNADPRQDGAETVDMAARQADESASSADDLAPAIDDATEDGEVSTDDAVRSDDVPADPWRPVFDQTDDLGGLLTARSPLLARAFGRRERQAAAPDAGD